MLKKFLNSFWGWAVTLLLIIAMVYSLFKERTDYNIYKCATKELELKGIIIFVTGRTGYRQVQVDNRERAFSLNANTAIYRRGFNQYHFFGVGDSIIKVAGSKEVTVKNKDSVVVFTLSCDD